MNGDDSSESADENLIECRHTKNAVDLSRCKKALSKGGGFHSDCEECKKLPQVVNNNEDEDMGYEYDMSLWMCLKCGNQACGRARNQHALKHFETPHSDSHAMCVNTTTWLVWCYECDNEVNKTCRKNLLEAVEQLRRSKDQHHKKNNASTSLQDDIIKNDGRSDFSLGITTSTTSSTAATAGSFSSSSNNGTGTLPKIVTTSTGLSLPRARGLSNLGNTCFFNSVMQCLGQTPYLLTLLDETSQEGQSFRLPGGKLELKDTKETLELGSLEGTLDKWFPLNSTLAETLRELSSGRQECYVPRTLLSRLTTRMPQFGGGDQHDSHELLRNLLEAVREEDLKRYKSVILEKLGYGRKTDPCTVDEKAKQIIKFYGQQASEMLLPTEQVFRGVLVSTLQCQTCNHLSHVDEYFLDLSLPISEKQLPPIRRKAEEIEDNKPSKHQLKKEKRAERKKNRKPHKIYTNFSQIGIEGNNLVTTQDGDDVGLEKSDSESDADVEDNAEDVIISNSSNKETGSINLESGYNSEKIYNSSPDSNRCNEEFRAMDSGIPSPTLGKTISSNHLDGPSSTHLCNNSEDEEFERPESRLGFVNNNNNKNDLKIDLAKLTLLNDGAGDAIMMSPKSDRDQDDDVTMDGACSLEHQEKMEEGGDDDEDDENNDITVWSSTIAPRYQCEEGECSVQSCLNQFTECELLAGTNRVGCERCTKRYGGKDKKTVLRDASKQLLIYNPPAVLILHLKRFQVLRYRPSKITKHVKFSTVLDLGPFCSKRARNLPTINDGQTKVLYSLYGVVEHSGSLHGGHYVAYVKVRAPLESNSYRWQFLPKNQASIDKKAGAAGAAEPEIPQGKWYYISDSYVSEVAESKVLSANAYLLFYERIL